MTNISVIRFGVGVLALLSEGDGVGSVISAGALKRKVKLLTVGASAIAMIVYETV
jgi:ABC-type proline/glycine betaine transport system permease subunit